MAERAPLEALGARVDGSLLMVEIALSNNLNSLTLEQVDQGVLVTLGVDDAFGLQVCSPAVARAFATAKAVAGSAAGDTVGRKEFGLALAHVRRVALLALCLGKAVCARQPASKCRALPSVRGSPGSTLRLHLVPA